MHPVFHSFKRLHWSSMRFARDWAEEYGTTPARFDMMLTIARAGGITMANLRRALDVCGPVVSRMLEALEDLGLARREPYERDRRTYWVTLTPRGQQRLAFAQAELLEEGFTETQLRIVVSADPEDETVNERAFAITNTFLRRLRTRVVDRSHRSLPGVPPLRRARPGLPRPGLRPLRRPVHGTSTTFPFTSRRDSLFSASVASVNGRTASRCGFIFPSAIQAKTCSR